ncbi:hypothetical protein [Caudoviricetes sp.]|nr:hypothetical protein [Caudoviricetes sp.]
MIFAIYALVAVLVGLAIGVQLSKAGYRLGALRFGATVRKYDVSVTPEIAISGAISQGLLYGISSGVATLATNAAGAFVYAIGFAVTAMTAADASAGKKVALANKGILDLVAGDIEGGSFTAGAPVYLHTGGKYTTTRPTTNGTLLQQVGIALSTTRVFVSIAYPAIKAQTSGNSNVGGL